MGDPQGSRGARTGTEPGTLPWVSTVRGAPMNRFSKVVLSAQKKASTWRAFWVLLALGLVALGAGAPGEYGFP